MFTWMVPYMHYRYHVYLCLADSTHPACHFHNNISASMPCESSSVCHIIWLFICPYQILNSFQYLIWIPALYINYACRCNLSSLFYFFCLYLVIFIYLFILICALLSSPVFFIYVVDCLIIVCICCLIILLKSISFLGFDFDLIHVVIH